MNDKHNEEIQEEVVNDVSFEETNEEGEVDAKATIKKLRERIKTLEKENKEYLDQSLRTRADYANYKKEVEQAKVADRKFATRRFIEELLPVLDAYTMAQGNKEAWEKVDATWRMGIEYIFGQFTSVLEKEGLTLFGKVGDSFDPMLHEAMQTIPVTESAQDNTVMLILQNGYKMHDVVLRPARVHVGHYEKTTE